MDASEATRVRMEGLVRERQDAICRAIGELDGARFVEDVWARPGGGGGASRVLQDGNVFEKAGVNVAVLHGVLPPEMARPQLGANHGTGGAPIRFFSAGLSVILHPHNPMAPTAHAYYR